MCVDNVIDAYVSIVLMIHMCHECEYFSCRSLSANEPLIVGIGICVNRVDDSYVA